MRSSQIGRKKHNFKLDLVELLENFFSFIVYRSKAKNLVFSTNVHMNVVESVRCLRTYEECLAAC